MSSQLQNKLLHYEAQPPSGVWDKIAPLFDDQLSPILSDKLYQYEEDPSLKVWQNINRQLNTPSKEGKVVPFYIRYKKPLKYSGAAAIFLFIAVLTSLLISKKTESELPSNSIVQNKIIKKDSSNPFVNSEEKNSLFSKKENSKPDQTVAKSTSQRQQTERQHSYSFTNNLLPQQAEKNDNVVNTTIDKDKYMIYSDGEGNAIRLPKKIFSAFTCPTEDIICKQRLQLLREKFAASAMTADFNGFLQILKSLQENQ